jgi:lipopolysaccharide export system protein LptC
MSHGNWQQIQNYWLPLAIVGGLVLLTAWQGRLSEQHPIQAGPSAGHDPDYFVDDLVATAYDTAGVPRYHLSANKMVHYLDDNTTSLESPTFLRDGPGVPRVAARSSHGAVSADGEIVYLLGDVHMTEAGQGDQMPIELTTQYLKIMPNADLLSTDKPVTLIQGASVVTANSMLANGKERTMQLSGRVKGIYETHR